jgi:HAMP domain-containing protein
MQAHREALGSETAILYRVKGKSGKEFYQAYSTSLGEEESAKQITAALKGVHAEAGSAPGSGELIKEMAWIQSVVAKGLPSASFEAALGGTAYLARVAPVQESWQFGAGNLVYVVMRDQDEATSPLNKLWIIAIGTAVAMLLVVMMGLIVGNSVLKPVEQLEAEVRTVIEGNWEHRWEIKSSEVGGLSYLINNMLDSLLEEEEEEEEGEHPRATTEEEFMAAGSEPTPESLASEPEEQYYQRTFQEFQQAKAQLGEDPNEVNYEQFVAKLRETEKNILAKQPGRMVRFIIQVQGNKINYKPVHIP